MNNLYQLANFEKFDFYENLAKNKHNPFIGLELKRKIEDMKQSRSAWYEAISKNLKALGLSDFYDTSKQDREVINSTFLYNWISLKEQFATEILQPMNLVSFDVKGRTLMANNPQLQKAIEEIEKYGKMAVEDINQRICREWPEFLTELERAFGTCFLTGGAVCKIFVDPVLNRPSIRMIEPENFLIDPFEMNLETAREIYHTFDLCKDELDEYIQSGIFIDHDFSSDRFDADITNDIQATKDEIAYVSPSLDKPGEDKYTFVEGYIYANPEEIGDYFGKDMYPKHGKLPYKITFHYDSGMVVRQERGWYPNKNKIERKLNMFHFSFFKGIDFWGIGLGQILTSLHNNASEIQTNLNKALILQNMPTAIMTSQWSLEKNEMTLEPGKMNQVNTDNGSLDSVKHIPMPEPSPMFMEYQSLLENKMNSLAGISNLKVESLPANMKGSVLLMLLDKEYKNLSASMRRFINTLNTFYAYLKDMMAEEYGEEVFFDENLLNLRNKDVYEKPYFLTSSADPNYTNSSLQYILYQTIFEVALQHPELHHLDELYRKFYDTLKLPDIDAILMSKEELAQQQQQMQQQQQQMMQMQQQQVQAQQQQQEVQNQILMKELSIHEEKQRDDKLLAMLKINMEKEIEIMKDERERIRQKGESYRQRIEDKTKVFTAVAAYDAKKKDMELKYGVKLPDIDVPDFYLPTEEDFDKVVDDTPIPSLNSIVPGEEKLQSVPNYPTM